MNNQLQLFEDTEENKEYQNFVEKFKPKKTTDDCYTPPVVYDAVLNYVKEKCNIEGLRVLRPFYPNGDYENETYNENCVVIDNPPFSIISQIIRFYLKRNVKFFLFAPHLTLFSSDQDYTSIATDAFITYENGAKIKTSFVSNMFGNKKIIGCPDLSERLKAVQKQNKACLPRYVYPDNIVTVSKIAQLVNKGIRVEIDKKDTSFCQRMDAQKLVKKSIYGSGFLVSDKTAQELKAQKEVVYWGLSDREKQIIKTLE